MIAHDFKSPHEHFDPFLRSFVKLEVCQKTRKTWAKIGRFVCLSIALALLFLLGQGLGQGFTKEIGFLSI